MNKLDVNSDMYRIVGCALAVYNHLKPGYLESVYEKALEKELTAEGFAVRRQVITLSLTAVSAFTVPTRLKARTKVRK